MKEAITEKHYDTVFARRAARPLSFAIDRYGDDDFGAVSGLISYVSRKDVERHSQILRKSLARVEDRNRIVVEFGCGTGGYVRHMSRVTNASIIGIDSSSVAIAIALRSVAPGTEFFCRDVRQCGLPSSSAGAALAIDLFHLTEDRSAVLNEIFRVLVPRATLVFTVLDDHEIHRTVVDWSTALQEAGFMVTAVRNTSDEWQQHMLAKHSWRWGRRSRLRSVLGSWIEPELKVSAAMLGVGFVPSVAKSTFRTEFVAVKR